MASANSGSESAVAVALQLLFVVVLFLIGVGHAYGDEEENGYIEVAGYGDRKLSNVFVSGKIVCGNEYLPRAEVGLHCRVSRQLSNVFVAGISNENGDYVMEVPSLLHPPERMSKCQVTTLHKGRVFKAKIALLSSVDGFTDYAAPPLDVCIPSNIV